MVPTKVLIEDPRPSGLLVILTCALIPDVGSSYHGMFAGASPRSPTPCKLIA